MIELKSLVDWHQGLTLPVEFGWYAGPREPEYGRGDNVGVVTATSGPAPDLEDIGDWFGFQVKLVGQEFQYEDLQRAAMALDHELRFLAVPADLWGARVRAVVRTGGAPEMIQEDEHNRIAFVGNYLVHELI